MIEKQIAYANKWYFQRLTNRN